MRRAYSHFFRVGKVPRISLVNPLLQSWTRLGCLIKVTAKSRKTEIGKRGKAQFPHPTGEETESRKT